ncbi:EVE domain-containing protein [Stakelama tenebrarum]|uniref:EVE domain-containing protein n=1 Tax=Stakelama tenebrarum TaxID=2711215 RepID=A0A6G6Y9U2_9SPHN|nr:EVE domain-containing protein [Sphingosinithalassobacter tenebrarum]QIG81343.1 EVE domain-containing protein [Sphingosinithalassobacter tenebrarum]
MQYWLMKSEPESYSWDDLVRDKGAEWDGVRNAAAAKHLKSMRVGDNAFLYHSGKQKAVIGIMEIARTAQQDGPDPRWVSVAVIPLAPLPRPVPLGEIRAEPALAGMAMLRQSRLSVSPVAPAEWEAIRALAAR